MKKLTAGVMMAIMVFCTVLPCTVQAEELAEAEEYPVAEESEPEAAEEQQPVHYLYVGSPYLEAPGTQEIVLSFGEDGEDCQNVTLEYEDGAGVKGYIPCVRQAENAYLFTKEFREEERGIYHITAVSFEKNEEAVTYELKEMGISAYFGVNEYYEGAEQSEYVEMEQFGSESQEEVSAENTSLVMIDENNLNESEELISEALKEAQKDVEETASNEGIATIAAAVPMGIANTPNVLTIVLDPGHDKQHSGAWNASHTVNEYEITLKIAQYCKSALERHAGLTVLLTRNGADCPFPNSTDNIDDIKKRVAWAKSKGADVFISFHLDSGSAAARGATVYYSIGSDKGEQLSEKIWEQLKALGLTGRSQPVQSADYTVNEESVKNGFPGLIIEHGFLSNPSEESQFLANDEKLKRLGESDAAGILNYFGLTNGSWKQENNKWYYLENGNKVKSQERCIGGYWYYFDDQGAMVTGWSTHKNSTGKTYKYYYDEKGHMVYGERCIGDGWYYFDEITGVMATGWTKHHNNQYYYDNSGRMAHGETKVDGSWYYFDSITGVMKTGLVKYNGKTCYFDSKGRRIHGETVLDGKWKYFDESTGAMAVGWSSHKNSTGKYYMYYYDSTGGMVYGRQTINGQVYDFEAGTGILLSNRIMGSSSKDCVSKMSALFQKKGKSYPAEELSKGGAPDIQTFCQICYEEATDEGIRPEVLYSQVMEETGWLRFGGDVKIQQFNFGGLGATGGGVAGEDFSKYGKNGVRMGLRAQVQHLKAYASEAITRNKLKHECVDSRFDYVTKGSAIYIDWLGIQENPQKTGWASGAGYGSKILSIMRELENTAGTAGSSGSTSKNGWETKNGKKYYYRNGVMLRGCESVVDGAWRWFDDDGSMAADKDVYLRSNGGKWVHYNKNGEMVKGWYSDYRGTYYFDPITGAMYKGARWINGKSYYFYEITGIMVQAKNKEMVIDGAWRWFEEDGQVAMSKDVYLRSNGGKWVRYNEKAKMVKGWYTDRRGTYYFHPITGEMFKGRNVISGRSYYFNEITGILR